MKVWRKNRTQFAQLFPVGDKMVMAFLVGQHLTKRFIQTVNNGEIKTISVGGKSDGVNNESNEFEETSETKNGMTIKKRDYKDGSVMFLPYQ